MSTGHLNLNYRRWGSGQPLIIVHGLFGSVVNWKPFGMRLAQEWSVFVLDLRNHGDSPHDAQLNYEVLREDLEAFMAQQGIEKAVLLGHSLGGKVIMTFADRFPEKAERLIVLDIAPKPYPTGHQDMLEAMIGLDLQHVKSRNEALEKLAAAIPSMAVRQFLLKNLARGGDGRYRWKINLDAIYKHLDELSEGPRLRNQYLNPTLFIRGGASAYITEEDVELIRRFYPNARVVTIDGAGHWLHADDREKTLQTVNDFLHSK